MQKRVATSGILFSCKRTAGRTIPIQEQGKKYSFQFPMDEPDGIVGGDCVKIGSCDVAVFVELSLVPARADPGPNR
jgi:hypothetical protein